MSIYDGEYYFIEKSEKSEKLPSLTPDENTEDRNFRFDRQPFGSPPLVFLTALKRITINEGSRE
ncbi:hypothetical protein HSX11_08870 [Oxalobacteraceae bacterium]|nr:hypothetical protein [Oxalobacteraceae bacterium]